LDTLHDTHDAEKHAEIAAALELMPADHLARRTYEGTIALPER